jgi:iron-sulfur cluster repair protein YtfE (RIC family)
MLHEITSSNSRTQPESAVDLLTGCHNRIRHFTAILRKLAHAEGSPLDEISSAADSAYHYFTVALPLHEADEEESVRPRLLKNATPEIRAALDAMTHQHEAIDDLIERLMPVLVLVSNTPAKLLDAHGELCKLSTTLAELFAGHLKLEEEVLFPALASSLSVQAQSALLVEMQTRRQQG